VKGKGELKKFHPKRIIEEEIVQKTEMSRRIKQFFPDIKVEQINNVNYIFEQAAKEEKAIWQDTLLLARQRGPFLRLCPGTQKHICCLYFNLDLVAGCDLDCSYCILQGYINNPLITVYCNHDDMYAELDQTLKTHPNQFYRIGTGELSDSLTFDYFLGIGPELVNYFADKNNAIIELKTKNIHIERLLGLKHNRRAVISWSMNADSITNSEEPLTPDIKTRLAAANEIQKAGYRLGFHFDPMIYHENWEDGYRQTVDKIFNTIKPENIAWISLGALRYPPALDDIIREKHPETGIVLGELLPGKDKKLRYFRPIRVQMFEKMYTWIKEYSPEVFVYLCMESKEVWEKAFNWAPGNSAELKKLLDERVK